MTAKELDDTLKAIVANAKAMRDAGVIGRVVVNGVEFELDAPDPVGATVVPQMGDTPTIDPLNDGDTYGGGEVPKRRRSLDQEAARAEFEKE